MPKGIYERTKPPWNKGELIGVVCNNCGKECLIYPYRKNTFRFCSYKCKGLWMSKNWIKENSPHWEGGKPKCIVCGKEITRRAKCCIKHSSVKYWLGKKRAEISGENHYLWKGENCKKKDERNDPLYKNWTLRVKKRDKWRCRINNKDCSGYCETHHILSWSDFPELRYEINNGITLCQAHHPKKRAEEKQLIPFFQELVGVSKC